MTPTAPGEAALAVIGLSNIIKGDVPKVGVGKLEEIQALPKRIAQLAKELTANTLPEPTLPREHSYRATLDRLSKGIPPHEIQELIDRFPETESDMAGEFVIVVQNAFNQLKTIFPTSDYNTFAGPTQMVPDTERVWTFFLQLQVLNDPLSVFPLIGAGAILVPQVQVMQEFYPTLSKAIDDSIYAATIDARAVKQSYRLPDQAETGLAVWRGRRIAEFNSQPAQPPPAPIKPPLITKLPQSELSQGQKASNPNA